MIPDCDGRSDGRSDGQTDCRTESIMAKTALCIASYADALSKIAKNKSLVRTSRIRMGILHFVQLHAYCFI